MFFSFCKICTSTVFFCTVAIHVPVPIWDGCFYWQRDRLRNQISGRRWFLSSFSTSIFPPMPRLLRKHSHPTSVLKLPPLSPSCSRMFQNILAYSGPLFLTAVTFHHSLMSAVTAHHFLMSAVTVHHSLITAVTVIVLWWQLSFLLFGFLLFSRYIYKTIDRCQKSPVTYFGLQASS